MTDTESYKFPDWPRSSIPANTCPRLRRSFRSRETSRTANRPPHTKPMPPNHWDHFSPPDLSASRRSGKSFVAPLAHTADAANPASHQMSPAEIRSFLPSPSDPHVRRNPPAENGSSLPKRPDEISRFSLSPPNPHSDTPDWIQKPPAPVNCGIDFPSPSHTCGPAPAHVNPAFESSPQLNSPFLEKLGGKPQTSSDHNLLGSRSAAIPPLRQTSIETHTPSSTYPHCPVGPSPDLATKANIHSADPLASHKDQLHTPPYSAQLRPAIPRTPPPLPSHTCTPPPTSPSDPPRTNSR